MGNNLDKQYQLLLQDILDNGIQKGDRTGTGTTSVFARQIRHKMSEGFPLLTTKKMAWNVMVVELLWFLRGDTNIKFLIDNGCNIWNGDAKKNYDKHFSEYWTAGDNPPKFNNISNEEFINRIKTDDKFAKKWGELGPIYGKQWRNWRGQDGMIGEKDENGTRIITWNQIDQIANLINELKTNPDSRRLMVNAWNVGELDQMVLPPCHYGFQVYTRELSLEERIELVNKSITATDGVNAALLWELSCQGKSKSKILNALNNSPRNIPTRAISLMWNQRSVDTFLGLPFNIASYGLLLEIIAKEVNMIPDELIGNLGDVHLYTNHIEQAKKQIGRNYTPEERNELLKKAMGEENYNSAVEDLHPFGGGLSEYYDSYKIPYHSREPFELPKLNINTEFWQTESGECGIGPLKTNLKGFEIFDFQIENYQSHPTIKAPLSN